MANYDFRVLMGLAQRAAREADYVAGRANQDTFVIVAGLGFAWRVLDQFELTNGPEAGDVLARAMGFSSLSGMRDYLWAIADGQQSEVALAVNGVPE